MPDTDVLSTERKSCELCGLACGRRPYKQHIREQDLSFCCLGCLNVYLILAESDTGGNFRESELFKRSLELGLISRPEGVTGVRAVASVAATSAATGGGEQEDGASSGAEELVLHVRGMWCTSCAWLIEYAVSKLRGVTRVEASFATDLVKIRYQPQFIPPGKISERIHSLGYKASEFRPGADADDREKRDMLLRLGLAAFLWMNVMYLSLTFYISFFEHISDSVRRYVPFVVWGLATPVVFYCGYPILRLAWIGLRNRTIRSEALLSMGILAAYFFSIAQAFRGDSHIYFDTACVIVTLVLAGKMIEKNAKDRASRWITMLHRWMPNKVRLLVNGNERFARVDALEPGQIFLAKAGEYVVADGVVAAGESHADESLLTGESTPVRKRAGDTVIAGSINLDGVLEVRAVRAASDSTLTRLVSLVEQALSSRSPLERTVDRVSRIFVPSVVGLALVTFAVLWFAGIASFGTSLMRAITVLVIACPCALGLATPLAITAAIGSASRRGVLFRDGGVLETVRKVDAVILDKTGTVTEGRFSLLDFIVCDGESRELAVMAAAKAQGGARGFEDEPPYLMFAQARAEALSVIASLEQYSEHPLGEAVVNLARNENAELVDASNIVVLKGLGLTGTVGIRQVFVGNRRLLMEQGILLPPAMGQQAQSYEAEGKTVAFFGWESELKGMAVFGDRVREDAVILVGRLKKAAVPVYLVSGDSKITTEWAASVIGAEHAIAETVPEKKAEFVKSLQDRGFVVAMVGDGINDAPALAQADLSISMGSGADIALKAASVVLMRSSLDRIPEVFELASRTMRVVRQNLFWAFFYNTVGITLAISGILNPILAGGAMLLSSASVVLNSLRLSRAVTGGAALT